MNKKLAIFAFSLLLSSCSIYKMEVQQGNALSNKTVTQLRKGMSKDEVASLLGSPLLQDNFRENRWDYIFYKGNGGTPKKQQNLTIFFKNGQLSEVKK